MQRPRLSSAYPHHHTNSNKDQDTHAYKDACTDEHADCYQHANTRRNSYHCSNIHTNRDANEHANTRWSVQYFSID